MNKKTLTLIIGLVAIGGGLTYLKTNSSSPSTLNPNPNSNTQITAEAIKFAQAVKSGKPYTCILSKDDSQVNYQLKDGKMNITITTKDKVSHMINDGKYIYSWGNQSNQGTKMPISTPEELAKTTETNDNTPDIPNFNSISDPQNQEVENLDIKCKPTSLSEAVFTPPASIKFVDPTAMIKEIQTKKGEVDLSKLKDMAKEFESSY